MWDHIIRVSLLILVLSHAIVKYLYTVYVENKCFNEFHYNDISDYTEEFRYDES